MKAVKRIRFFVVFVVALSSIILLLANPINATEPSSRVSFDQIAKKSELICTGVVIDVRSELKGLKKSPTDIFTVKADEVYLTTSGNVTPGATFEITIFSGRPGAPRLLLSQSYLFFLIYNPQEAIYNIVLGEEGVFEIEPNSSSLLNIHGFYIEDLQDNKLVVGPQSPRHRKVEPQRESPPPSYQLDETGKITNIVNPVESLKAQDSTRNITADELMEKVMKMIEK